MRSMHSLWFAAPERITEDEARAFAYVAMVDQYGPGADLPDGASIVDGAVTIKPRPDPAPDDWPEGTVYVLVQAWIDDGTGRRR